MDFLLPWLKSETGIFVFILKLKIIIGLIDEILSNPRLKIADLLVLFTSYSVGSKNL